MAVDGNRISGANAKGIASGDFGQRYLAVPVGGDFKRGRRLQAQKRPDGLSGAVPGAKLQHLPHGNQDGNCGRGLEVDRYYAAVALKGSWKNAREQQRGDAINVGGAHAQPDEAEHIELPGADGLPEPLEERRAGPQHHGRGEHELDPRRDIGGNHLLNRIPGNQVSHGQNQYGDAE